MVNHTLPPLIISRLEGDAVIAYAPIGSFLQGQTLIELLENTYVAFRQARERMQLNTTCTCNACRNIPNLDLKFLVHFGTYVLQDMLTYRELVGSDVNLAHRLLKNHIVETTGITAYAAYSVASVEELGILQLCLAMRPHRESYEHLGEVGLYVQDMHAVWERERERQRVVVEPRAGAAGPGGGVPRAGHLGLGLHHQAGVPDDLVGSQLHAPGGPDRRAGVRRYGLLLCARQDPVPSGSHRLATLRVLHLRVRPCPRWAPRCGSPYGWFPPRPAPGCSSSAAGPPGRCSSAS